LRRTLIPVWITGNRSRETIARNAGAQAATYGYDSADRLTQTSVVEADKTVTTVYELDAVSNRSQETVTTTPASGSASSLVKSYTYDGRNQLKTITDSVAGTTVLAYDLQGNLTSKTLGNDQTYYRYNARDNLISVTRNSTLLGSYSNDHLGLRIEKEAKDPLQPGAPPVRLRTLWDGRNAFQDSSTDGVVVSRYESDGRHPVSMWSSTDGSQALHHDALGSIVATTDTTGAIKSETIYDAFGNVQERTGASANKFGYTGHQMDQESGLIYFQARYYDPSIGRFITQDPFEGDVDTPASLHHYLYAYANPTTYVDFYGYESISRTIDNAAEGCGAWSCAGYALLKGLYAASTFGFSVVHDPVRDMYDDGKISGAQYAGRGIGGGAAAVAINAAGVAVGSVGGGVATSLLGKAAVGAAVGAATAGGTDAVSQGVNIAAGLQDHYDGGQTATAAAWGAGVGAVAPAVAAGIGKLAATEAGQAVSSAVRKTVEAVKGSASSVSGVVKGIVTREGGELATAGSPIRSQSVPATVFREGEVPSHMPVGDEPLNGHGGFDHPIAAKAAPVTQPLPSGVDPYQLELFPKVAYERVPRYGNTPTAAQKASVPAGMEFDHDPMLVKHYYEGPGDGTLPGYNLTGAERKAFGARLDVGSAATPSQQRAQGAAAARYSKAQKKIWGLRTEK
jgi:RHS repeat-associated protein